MEFKGGKRLAGEGLGEILVICLGFGFRQKGFGNKRLRQRSSNIAAKIDKHCGKV
jgi:hypothetical protein